MDKQFPRALDKFKGHPGFRKLLHGLEKEALRVDRYGYLSQDPHPEVFGSALTNSIITTDFSEAQLEFITQPHHSIEQCMREMEEIHCYVYQHLDNEILWPSSMPCMLKSEQRVPIADYGNSNLGKYKQLYRRGLGVRYGRYMQTISGLHFNFSISQELWNTFADFQRTSNSVEFRNQSYLSLIRNFRRYSWLLLYLFGASPAVCGSFLAGQEHDLQSEDSDTFYLPHATSLRSGRLGYQSKVQSQYPISFNSISDYVESMVKLLSLPYPQYEELGVHNRSGQFQQLSTAILQIEAESYGVIRPKPRAQTGLRPIVALQKFGIEYLEVRCLDLNPFCPTGIDKLTLYFLDVFMLWSWMLGSRLDSPTSWNEVHHNQAVTVNNGRAAETTISLDGVNHNLRDLGTTIVESMVPLATIIDEICETTKHSESVRLQLQKLADSELTPSAEILREIRLNQPTYYHLVSDCAKKYQRTFLATSLPLEREQAIDSEAARSIEQERAIAQADHLSYEEYLEESAVVDFSA
ncbi:MAG: glutamate--cysteine ligase [Gammaproteobacteria bacterium]|nr:glutamate--cysteine ligase [Gammaproteobacteria bacterium]